jgi:hypothetical protein
MRLPQGHIISEVKKDGYGSKVAHTTFRTAIPFKFELKKNRDCQSVFKI